MIFGQKNFSASSRRKIAEIFEFFETDLTFPIARGVSQF